MIEYLYHHTDKLDPKLYYAKIGCPNCENVRVMQVQKGKKVDDWIKDQKLLCTVCGCEEVLQSWRQFLAGRAMLTQLIDFANKEEDVENKKMSHYG